MKSGKCQSADEPASASGLETEIAGPLGGVQCFPDGALKHSLSSPGGMSLSLQSPHYGKAGGDAAGAKPPAAREGNLNAGRGCRADILGMEGCAIRRGAVPASAPQGPTPRLTEAAPGYAGGSRDTGPHGKPWDRQPLSPRPEQNGGRWRPGRLLPGDQEASGRMMRERGSGQPGTGRSGQKLFPSLCTPPQPSPSGSALPSSEPTPTPPRPTSLPT